MKRHNYTNPATRLVAPLILLVGLTTVAAKAQINEPVISMAMRETSLAEVMQMLSRAERVNILLSDDVEGEVSFSIYDVPLSEAIRSIADAAGYAVEHRNGMYFVVDRDQAGAYAESDLTEIKVFPIEYADPVQLQTMLTPYLSDYGQMTILAENKMLMVEDTPEFLRRIEALVREVDLEPRQILIEAKILEVTLTDEDSYGIDWTSFFESNGGTGSFGTRGLAGAGASGSSGLFFNMTNADLTAAMSALELDGRIRTLSTPKLLALEHQEASVIVGDRRGYTVTTTINQVSTESVEFLESGVILRVTPYVDREGRIMMDIHPEVSTGVVDIFGIPSQTTTEVTTRLLVDSGQTVFIGGLIKQTLNESRKGVPVLGRIPGVGLLFSSRETTSTNTETVVMITPWIVGEAGGPWNAEAQSEVEEVERRLQQRATGIDESLNQTFIEFDPVWGTDSIAESN